jgi:hypothetical protein
LRHAHHFFSHEHETDASEILNNNENVHNDVFRGGVRARGGERGSETKTPAP